ncbi:MAG: hypothetical protein ABI045_00660 [Flavobacteriales bacterium]
MNHIKDLLLLQKGPSDVKLIEEIPFLLIYFFKTHTVWSGIETQPEIIFTNSGITDTQNQHHIAELNTYIENFRRDFQQFSRPIKD